MWKYIFFFLYNLWVKNPRCYIYIVLDILISFPCFRTVQKKNPIIQCTYRTFRFKKVNQFQKRKKKIVQDISSNLQPLRIVNDWFWMTENWKISLIIRTYGVNHCIINFHCLALIKSVNWERWASDRFV